MVLGKLMTPPRRGTGELVVAIDGPAGAGKSTAAKTLAQRLGYVLVDTGALYRGVALAAFERGVDWEDGGSLGNLVDGLSLSFQRDADGSARLTIDGNDRSADIRTPHISTGASRVSRHAAVRRALLGLQRRLGAPGGVVLEGRDIGTVVFPDARLKLFVTASPRVRAERRVREIGGNVDEIEHAIIIRDRKDSTREHSPLTETDDAVLVDTTGMTIDEVVEHIMGML